MSEKKASDIIGNLRINYDRAVQAIQRENFDYAIELLSDLLKKDPSNLDVRFKLRDAAQGKAGKGGGFFRKVINTAGGGHHLAKAQLALKSNPQEALHEAEQMLLGDPQNVAALKISAEAAVACGFVQTSLRTLTVVHRLAPEDVQANTRLANLYCELGEPEKAEKIYSVLCRHHPGDPSLQMAAKNIAARRTMQRGGYEDGSPGATFRRGLKDVDEAQLLERQSRGHKDAETVAALLAEYEKRFETDPENVKLVKDIAELHALRHDYYRALEYYNHLATLPNAMDSAVERTVAEVTGKRYDQAVEELDPAAEDYAERKAELVAAKVQYLFDDARDRVRRYPTDMDARFELGLMLFERSDFDAAIKEFQHVQKFPRLKRKGMLYLSRCFAARGMRDMAIGTLRRAAEEKVEIDDEQKELLYTLGQIHEQGGEHGEAIKHYKAIFEVDIAYRDVAAKVQAHYES